MTPEMASPTRIYVGGLGERVTEEDLRKTFSNLGSIEAVDIIRTKGRSFAYINFIPSSDNSLAKLFSMYNGCLWKGGKLKLEKAKEHYTDRLKREWAEDDELINSANTTHDDGNVDENIVASAEMKSSNDTENMQIRIFFPKLCKIRSLPVRGTGKHKYSFQRLQVPSLPVHFCDCPEHYVPDKTPIETINQNSHMNRHADRKTFLGSKRLQRPNEIQVQDSKIQDCGMNEEEINVMNSVMKKLLDRETSLRTERKDVGDASQRTIPTSDNPVDTNEIDYGTDDDEDDDDDIKINTVAGQNSGSFSESNVMNSVMKKLLDKETSWNDVEDASQRNIPTSDIPVDTNEIDNGTDDDDDIQINMVAGQNIGSSESWDNKMAMSKEDRNADLAAQTEFLKTKENLTNKKRKSNSESNEKDRGSSPMCKKKACLQTQSNDSEDRMEYLKSETESGTKKPSTPNSVWSQKSAWRELVGDGVSSSFSLSHITAPNNDSNSEEDPNPGNKAPSDNEEQPLVSTPSSDSNSEDEPNSGNKTSSDNEEPLITTHSSDSDSEDEPNPGNETPSENEEALITTPSSDSDSEDEPNPGSETPSDNEAHEGLNNVVENLDAQPSEPSKKEQVLADKSIKGSSWLQKSSWTQLVGGENTSSFSISQILPANIVVEKQELQKPNAFSTTTSFSGVATRKEKKTSEAAAGGSRGSKSGLFAPDKKRDAEVSASKGIGVTKARKSSDSERKGSSSKILLGGVGISESCPFMRSDDSVKDWMTAKAALSSSLKKRNNNKKQQ